MDEVKQFAEKVVGPCSCAAEYKERDLADPRCAWCDHGMAVAILVAQYDLLFKAADWVVETEEDYAHDNTTARLRRLLQAIGDLRRVVCDVTRKKRSDHEDKTP